MFIAPKFQIHYRANARPEAFGIYTKSDRNPFGPEAVVGFGWHSTNNNQSEEYSRKAFKFLEQRVPGSVREMRFVGFYSRSNGLLVDRDLQHTVAQDVLQELIPYLRS